MIESVNASRKNVRKFGHLFGAICLLATAFLLYKGSGAWIWTAAGAVFYVAGGVVAYPVLKPVYIGWMMFAFVLGWINTRLLLGLFYYLVMTPIGLGLRIAGKDLLEKKIDRKAITYWIKRERRRIEPERYERMF